MADRVTKEIGEKSGCGGLLDNPLPAEVKFRVLGTPAGMGSKRAFVTSSGRAAITDDNQKEKRMWANQITTTASDHFASPFRGPVAVKCVFYMMRPSGHFGSGRNAGQIKNSAPRHHAHSPDIDKLARCALDALTGIAYVDDRQVCELVLRREWTEHHPGADISVMNMAGNGGK